MQEESCENDSWRVIGDSNTNKAPDAAKDYIVNAHDESDVSSLHLNINSRPHDCYYSVYMKPKTLK